MEPVESDQIVHIREEHIWSLIPIELKLVVLGWLDLKTLLDCSLVSNSFYQYCKDERIWLNMCHRYWMGDMKVNFSMIYDAARPLDRITSIRFKWKAYFVEKYLLSRKDCAFLSESLFPQCVSPRFRHTCTAVKSTSDEYFALMIGGTGTAATDQTLGDISLFSLQPVQKTKSKVLQSISSFFRGYASPPSSFLAVTKPSFEQQLPLTQSDMNIKIYKIEATPTATYKSSRHVAVLISDKLWIFGGSHSSPVVKTNDLWKFDLVTQNWEKVVGFGVPPSPRSDHSAVVVGKSIFIFGGSDDKVSPLNDVHRFDTETLTWSTLDVKGNPPSVRSGHTTIAVGNNIFLFGGARWDSRTSQWLSKSNELFIFDTVTYTWTKPSTSGRPPAVSTFAASFLLGNHIWIIGGGRIDGDYVSDTIYLLDCVTLKWETPHLKGTFTSKDCISATLAGNQVLLFGGYRGNPVNELQVLEMVWLDKMRNCGIVFEEVKTSSK